MKGVFMKNLLVIAALSSSMVFAAPTLGDVQAKAMIPVQFAVKGSALAVNTVKNHPVIAGTVVAAGAAFMYRKPITAAVKAKFTRPAVVTEAPVQE